MDTLEVTAPTVTPLLEEDLFEVPRCESLLPAHQHDHAAAFYAQCLCDHVVAICAERRTRARHVDGWWCVVRNQTGCMGFHPYDHIRFSPVRP